SSLYGLGIWAPVIFVVVLAMAGFMLYFFLDVYGIERDFMHADEDVCYDARQIVSGKTKTIFEDEILRLATPVDNSAHLFRKEK
ncbi:MAG: hypothetical protein JRN15_22470, partial [Nitrososphaerota archaeon]|nr:hypothetical protein [Nitrososphaerota archaeon]